MVELYTEVPVILLFFAFMICDPVTTNFIIYRTCYVTLGYNETDCAKLGTKNVSNATAALETIVEPHANVIMMTSSLTTQILPPLLCLFIGPWSDKNGRKPVMVVTLLGFLIGQIIQIVITTIPYLSPWFIMTASIPVILCGGFAPFIMAVMCHASDLTTPENRGLRLGIFEAVTALGMLGGTMSSAYLFEAISYTGVYTVAAICFLLAWLYVIFLTRETIVPTEIQDDSGIFRLSRISDLLRATFKKRRDYQRSVLLLIFVILALYLLASTADSTVIFLYLREKFGWSLDQYTLYKSTRSACSIAGTFIGIYVLHKLCRITEAYLIFVGFAFYFGSGILQGLAVNNWQLYLAGILRCISGVITPMARSLISKIVSYDEIGKVFSITVAMECLAMMTGSPIYTLIYNCTITTAPGMFNFVTAGLFGVLMALIIPVIMIQRKRGNQYTILESINGE